MKIMKQSLKLIFVGTLLLSTFVFAATKQQPLTVMLDWFVNPDHAPLFVAQQQGYFAKAGVPVKFIAPADPADPLKLVAAGKTDVAVTYQPQFMLAIAQGLPLVRIGTLIATPLNCLVVLKDGPIKSLKDLRGKRIGYSTGGVDAIMLDAMLKRARLTRQDVTLVNVHYNLTQALLAGRVDAVTGMMRNFEMTQVALAGKPGRAFFPEESGMPVYDELIIVTNKKEIGDPRLPRFLQALQAGTLYLVNHPRATWKVFAKQHPELNNELNKRAWFATLPRFALRPAVLDKQRYAKFAAYLQQQGSVKTLPPIATYAKELE